MSAAHRTSAADFPGTLYDGDGTRLPATAPSSRRS